VLQWLREWLAFIISRCVNTLRLYLFTCNLRIVEPTFDFPMPKKVFNVYKFIPFWRLCDISQANGCHNVPEWVTTPSRDRSKRSITIPWNRGEERTPMLLLLLFRMIDFIMIYSRKIWRDDLQYIFFQVQRMNSDEHTSIDTSTAHSKKIYFSFVKPPKRWAIHFPSRLSFIHDGF
jgi:hypothetical protein